MRELIVLRSKSIGLPATHFGYQSCSAIPRVAPASEPEPAFTGQLRSLRTPSSSVWVLTRSAKTTNADSLHRAPSHATMGGCRVTTAYGLARCAKTSNVDEYITRSEMATLRDAHTKCLCIAEYILRIANITINII